MCFEISRQRSQHLFVESCFFCSVAEYSCCCCCGIAVSCVGCPIKQEITDNSLVNADGDGLFRAFEDQVASFYVETGGQRGDLVVQVEGQPLFRFCIYS